MRNRIVPVFSALTKGTLPNMAVMGHMKKWGVGTSLKSLKVSAFLMQLSASGSRAQYDSSLQVDKRAHLVQTDPMTCVQTTMVRKSKHLQYHTLSGEG